MGTGNILLGTKTSRLTSTPSAGGGGGGEGEIAILLGRLHTKETGINSGPLGLWLVCAFIFF